MNLTIDINYVDVFKESEHKRGQPGNAGEFAKLTTRSNADPAAIGEEFLQMQGFASTEAYVKNLPAPVREAAQSYTRQSNTINEALRNDKPITDPGALRTQGALDDFLASDASRLKKSVKTYRGARISVADVRDMEEKLSRGQPASTSHKGFASTTLLANKANSFGNMLDPKKLTEGATFRISVAAGAHAMYMPPDLSQHNSNAKELELLLPRNQQMRVTKISRGKPNFWNPNGRVIIEATVGAP